MKKVFVLGFYDEVKETLDPNLRVELDDNIIWFGKHSEHQPFEMGKFRSRLSTELAKAPVDCMILLAQLPSERYVLEVVAGIVGSARSEQIFVTNDLSDADWLASTLNNLGFPHERDPLNLELLNQYFGGAGWRCLCIRAKFQPSYEAALNRARFPKESLQHFCEQVEEQSANTVQKVISAADSYSGVLYANKGLKYLPPTAREQMKKKRFHEATTTAKVIENLRLAIMARKTDAGTMTAFV